ncbi:MAG: hypothetical protein AAGI23_18005 [Bacteroidota bacterium]
MKTLYFLFFSCFYCCCAAQSYFDYAQTFADTLLHHATDKVGDRTTAMWGGVINAKTGQLPTPDIQVEPTEGTRLHDRAVWGSNYYHDVHTIKLMQLLTDMTGDNQYQKAAEAYTKDFLIYTQHPTTGLLGWGEHLYYHFYEDTVGVAEGVKSKRNRDHEFLADTPNWELLWQMDSTRTRRAIEGLQYHFRGARTQSYLFNRHAFWNLRKPEADDWRKHQYQRDGQPWIKHSSLNAQAFHFLYTKTGDKKWKEWSEGVGQLYWRHRNQETQLVPGCIDDQRAFAARANLNEISLLVYRLLKIYEQDASAVWAKEQAITLFKAAEKYCWDEKAKRYLIAVETDGSLTEQEYYGVFGTGYTPNSILTFGRVAAYFAHHFPEDKHYKTMLKRALNQVDQAELPKQYVINGLADVIHLYLDGCALFELPDYLKQAKKYANIGIEQLYVNGFFVRQPNDEYYEAKLKTGNFVLGLLRLHLAEHPEKVVDLKADWSF